MGICLDKDLLFSETKRNDLVSNSGTILQEQRELRAEGLVVDCTQVSESCSFEVKTLNIVHCKPATVDLFHAIFDDQVFERLVNVTP
jgi:hypothetical protein